ncbi:hypothetical protein ACIPUB_03125 [Paeniglutamicibacter sp. ORCA_105]|uniref:hypothetical protein n=1 Tax=Paeniglutamicibacter sp. ORCA_105 TaxID=3377336 RepID=UPI003895545B
MNTTQPIAGASSEKNPRVVLETSSALSTGMFHPIGGLDPDMSRGPRNPKPLTGLWSRIRTARA